MSIRIPLHNGWTISLSEDLPPSLVSVAAIPTDEPDAPVERWFMFGDSYDARCHSAGEMVEALLRVAQASAPGAVR